MRGIIRIIWLFFYNVLWFFLLCFPFQNTLSWSNGNTASSLFSSIFAHFFLSLFFNNKMPAHHVIPLTATAHCSSLWPRTSSPSPSCSGTKWWSAAPRGWWWRISFSSCLWWWTCWQRTLSPALSVGLWCKVFASSCLGGKANRRAGAPPRLLKSGQKMRQTGWGPRGGNKPHLTKLDVKLRFVWG